MKAAIIILSDPNSEQQESLGRVFNALAAAYDFKEAGKEVKIIFQGTGTRWPSKLIDKDHPAHSLYTAVADKIAGASCGCADVFGAAEDIKKVGLELITDNAVPGTTGLPSYKDLLEEGFTIINF
ncbi:hypothetical protein A9Q84_15220 [Halobacteriovorax marinus]|uniref:Uncharacterized protein n=1 Tax=Halobacteriovorax marinus TaxID=97084 RepID=A0A1Y5F5S5_9BACT|nr:hypothetical protein A9Q84_15220 [Halobacteriovorax marinus]